MKHHYFVPILIAFSLSSCIVVVDSTSSHFQDELYYSANEYAEEDAKDEAAYQDYLKENNKEEDFFHDEKLYEEEFDYDDCYDYYYSSRLRRFHSPHFGFSYYNNYYTNSFWYSHNPYNCGVSIYYGYNFWNPWYMDPWHNYHFGWGYNYLNHHWAYNNYWSYWNYPTYFNSYDNNSVYYGFRENNNNRTPEEFANRYIQEVKERPQRFDFINDRENNKPTYSGGKPSFDNTRPRPANKPSKTSSSKLNNSWLNNAHKPATNFNRPNTNKPAANYKKPNNRPASPVRHNNSQSTSPSRNNNSYNSSSPSRNSNSSNKSSGGSNRRPR
tara:strand:+ start:1875 stop:2855 length:981 start_codon:yes stop_codon:yes gene_type:complete